MLKLFAWGPTGWGDELVAGLTITVRLAVAAYALGLVIGVSGAAAALSRVWPLRRLALGYAVVGRAVPELLVIFLIFYGGNQALRAALSLVGYRQPVEVSAFVGGVVALGVIAGAAATAIFRGAILAVEPGQREAAQAFGLSGRHTFVLVVLPQAWRLALPGLTNVWMGLLKETALVSVVGLEDLLRVARIAEGATHEPLPFLLAAGVGYLVLTGVSLVLLRWLARLMEAPYRV